GDHGEKEHGFFVYREAVRVPLVVRLPRARRAGTRVGGVVAQVDLPATLLDLAGLPFDGMDGVSQRAAMGSGRGAARPVYSETLFPRYHFGWSELFAASDDRLRYIRAPRPELYDVRADPRETQNLVGQRPGPAASMSAWLERVSAHLELARIHALRGRREEAEREAAQASAADPGQAYEILAGLRLDAGRLADAATFARRAVAADPERAVAYYVLGLARQQAGRC